MTHNTREVEDIHKWEFLKEDKYHETWRSEYCGEIQVQKALADHIRHHQLQKARTEGFEEGYKQGKLEQL